MASPNNTVVMLIMALITQPRIKQFISAPRYSARNPRKNAAGLPPYRSSTNSTSVRISERRQYRAKKKTVIIPERHCDHHSQFPEIPLRATNPATNSGVSAANVVATMEVPASHQETLRPETKNSSVLPEERRR